jgi:FixJ family two-component response regulator
VISVVDDDQAFCRALARFMRSLGHPVAVFSSAEEFLSSHTLQHTVCLISDVRMSGMSGIELQTRLLAEGYRIPIIFVGADPEPGARGQALASRASCFLDKPFSEAKLLSCIEWALAHEN